MLVRRSQAFLFLLLCLSAVSGYSASVERTSAICPDGSYSTTGSASDCRPYLSSHSAGGNVTDTTAEVSATSTKTSGTFYSCPFPSETASGSYPDSDEIQAGTGSCLSGKEESVTVSSTDITLDGANVFATLTPEDSLKAASVHIQGVRISDVDISNTFVTLAAPGGGGTDLTGAGFFIADNDGGNTDETETGDAGTQTSGCTAMDSACSSLNHVSPAIGDNIYLAEGARFDDFKLDITQNGTLSDFHEWSCYFDEGDDDGNPVLCASTSEVRPEINGTFEDSDRTTGETSFPFGGSGAGNVSGVVPSNIEDGLVRLSDGTNHTTDPGASYVIVSHISAVDTAGGGFHAGDRGTHAIFDNVFTAYIGKLGVKFDYRHHHAVLINSEVHSAGYCSWYYKDVGYGDSSPDTCESDHPPIMSVARTSTSGNPPEAGTGNWNIVANTVFYDHPGEGFGGFFSGRVLVWNITVFDVDRAAIYLDSTPYSIVEGSIAFNTDRVHPHFGDLVTGDGISVIVESDLSQHKSNVDGVVRNNLFVATANCVNMTNWGDHVNSQSEHDARISANFFHNTCIEITGSDDAVDLNPSSFGFQNPSLNEYVRFVNNIVHAPGKSASTICDVESTIQTKDFRGNLFSIAPSNSDCSDASDPTAGIPNLTRSIATGWDSSNWTDVFRPTFAMATPVGGSNVDDAGVSLQTDFLDCSIFDNFSYLTDPFDPDAVNCDNWDKYAGFDAVGNTRDVSTPDIGAVGNI